MINKKTPRGLRLFNPGNIEQNNDKFQGEIIPSQDNRFKEFESIEYGYRAMFVTLDTYRKKYNRDTIDKIITAWAPAIENHTENYIKCVEQWSGVDRNKVLTEYSGEDYIKIVAAMSRMENGIKADMLDVLAGYKLQNRIKD